MEPSNIHHFYLEEIRLIDLIVWSGISFIRINNDNMLEEIPNNILFSPRETLQNPFYLIIEEDIQRINKDYKRGSGVDPISASWLAMRTCRTLILGFISFH